jgi:two-component system response regulator PhoP
MRVLIVEDDPTIRETLAARLRQEGYAVETAEDGKEGAYKAVEYPIDLAVVDLGLPEMSGIELIQVMRKREVAIPVLILTARGRWQDKVEGLDAGADDYLVKPFEIEELLARVKALLRRSKGIARSLLKAGPVELDLSTRRVELSGKGLELTAYEYKVLEYLMMHPGVVISKSRLSDHIYEEEEDRDSNVIEVFIGRLRKKLDPDGTLQLIETLRGQGYRFTTCDLSHTVKN